MRRLVEYNDFQEFIDIHPTIALGPDDDSLRATISVEPTEAEIEYPIDDEGHVDIVNAEVAYDVKVAIIDEDNKYDMAIYYMIFDEDEAIQLAEEIVDFLSNDIYGMDLESAIDMMYDRFGDPYYIYE